MDFFTHQEQAKSLTTRLLVLYTAAILGLVGIFYVGCLFIFAGSHSKHAPLALWQPGLFLTILVTVGTVVALGSFFKMATLTSWGASVAESLGGRLLDPLTADSEEKRCLNIVEEMALASGIPVPPVYVLDDQLGINAFAAGYKPADAVISVTRGTLNTLSRDELQGVIAHEFSHILNGDMRLNIRLLALLFGILILAIIGRFLVQFGGSSGSRSNGKNEGGNQLALVGLLLLVVGYLGVFVSRIIQSAVSRQREFLADASAVQFTRNPDGIGRALLTIATSEAGSTVQSPHADEVGHMFFAEGVGSWLSSIFSTHPPLRERISRVKPDLLLESGAAATLDSGSAAEGSDSSSPLTSGFSSVTNSSPLDSPLSVLSKVGTFSKENVEEAQLLRSKIPPLLENELRDLYGARGIVFALLLSSEPEVQERQLLTIARGTDQAVSQHLFKQKNLITNLPNNLLFPVVDLAISTLRRLSKEQYVQFRECCTTLANEDSRISLFELALLRAMHRHLDAAFFPRQKSDRLPTESQLTPALSTLLSALAATGSRDSAIAKSAFNDGLHLLPPPLSAITFIESDKLGADDINTSLDLLASASPQQKQPVAMAAIAVAKADNKITLEEYQLLRALFDALELPLPISL